MATYSVPETDLSVPPTSKRCQFPEFRSSHLYEGILYCIPDELTQMLPLAVMYILNAEIWESTLSVLYLCRKGCLNFLTDDESFLGSADIWE